MKATIKETIIDFCKDHRSTLLQYLFFSLATPISNIYLPRLYGQIISRLNETGKIDSKIKRTFVYIFVLWITVQFFWGAMNVLDSKFIPMLRKHIREYIVARIMLAHRQNYSEQELGGIMAELIILPDEIDDLFHNIRNHVLPMIYMLGSAIAYFMWTNPKLGMISLLAVGMYIGAAIKFSQRCIPGWDALNKSHRRLHDEISDSLGNLLNIYSSGDDAGEAERLDRFEQDFVEHHRQTIRCVGSFRLILNTSYIFLFCGVNILSMYLFSKGYLKLDDMVTVLIITLELISKMSGFVGSIDRIMYELATIQHAQRLLDKLDSGDLHSERKHGGIKTIVNGNIIVRGLNVRYGDRPVLEDFNLDIQQGSTVVLSGEIGSGKTSFINCLMRLIPFTGQITIGGVDIKNVDLDYLRASFIYIPQNPRLFNRSILENITFGIPNLDRGIVQSTLGRYNITIDLDRPAGKYGQSLSGGQRQIVYLLRCLFKSAPIVLLDEPTASLDSATKETVLQILADILKHRTVIMISHDQDVVKYATRVVHFSRPTF